MDRAARAGSGGAEKKGRFRTGMKGLLVLVAACALIIWAGLSIRDHFAGYQPLRALRSGDAIERRKAARDLAESGGSNAEAAMAALLDALRDEDARVRAEAARSLGVLLFRLRAQPATGPVAADLSKRRLDVAMRGLSRVLSDADASVRVAAAVGLGMMTGRANSGPQGPEQLAAIRDGSNTVRRRAARMIYGCPDATLPAELAAALGDESAEVRAEAARALSSFGTDLDPQIPRLFAMMVREQGDVRKACVQAIWAAWPTPSLVPTLLGFLESRDRDARYYAARLLGRIGPEARAAIPALIAVLNEPFVFPHDPDPAQAAARALGQMGPSREAIAALLDVIAPEKVARDLAAMRVVLPLLDAWQKLERLPATSPGVGGIGAMLGNVQVHIFSRLSRIRSAIDGLGDIGPPAVAAVPALLAAYRMALEVPRHVMAHTTIPAALGQIAPNSAAAPEAVAALIRALDLKDSPSSILGAIEALGHFGKDASAAIPRLRAFKEVRSSLGAAAAKSLAAIESPPGTENGGDRNRPLP